MKNVIYGTACIIFMIVLVVLVFATIDDPAITCTTFVFNDEHSYEVCGTDSVEEKQSSIEHYHDSVHNPPTEHVIYIED